MVKRFFLVDKESGKLQNTPRESILDDPAFFYEQYSEITYVRSMELRFQVTKEDGNNQITIPLLILNYATLNLTDLQTVAKRMNRTTSDSDRSYNVPFNFKITFENKCNFNFLLEIVLPIFISLAFLMSLLQTYFYKVRQQKMEFDFPILFTFALNLISTTSTAFFGFVIVFTIYVFFVYKSQSQVVEILMPLQQHEQNLIETFIYVALSFKTIKLFKMFYDLATVDIFFIDWERPKFSNGDNFQSFNKAHLMQQSASSPGTPSITSSLKPPVGSPSPTFDCVSAWRNYFIANEWQELITKRKISVHLHVIFVIFALLIFGFEHWASLEHFLHITEIPNLGDQNNKILKVFGKLFSDISWS